MLKLEFKLESLVKSEETQVVDLHFPPQYTLELVDLHFSLQYTLIFFSVIL